MGYRLHGAFPNPFNDATQILFTIPVSSRVNLKLHDLLGREVVDVVDSKYSRGTHRVFFNSKGLAGEVYFVQMNTGDFESTKKIISLK